VLLKKSREHGIEVPCPALTTSPDQALELAAAGATILLIRSEPISGASVCQRGLGERVDPIRDR
jgi:hypothetical protein